MVRTYLQIKFQAFKNATLTAIKKSGLSTQSSAESFDSDRASLVQALPKYAEKEPAFLKGAVQGESQINKYLCAVDPPKLRATELDISCDTTSGHQPFPIPKNAEKIAREASKRILKNKHNTAKVQTKFTTISLAYR